MDSSLTALISEWFRHDKNEQTRQEIRDLVSNGDIHELERRMRPRIAFGTAGLRAEMSAGWARMNDLIIIQTSQGLASYVAAEVSNAKERGIVIGYDHRHHSETWAQLAAGAFIRFGFKVYLHRRLVPTPLVPFSVSSLSAACGIMITASHNPKYDNGYKVYWENAVQIISPHDTGIAKAIEANLEPRSWDAQAALTHPMCFDVTDRMVAAYFKYLTSLSLTPASNSRQHIKFVNTSLHGVSNIYIAKAFRCFGLPPFYPVEEQQEPDPEFPSVKFPNPEERGALDLALKKAEECGASYVLAQDPDADRFSAAEKRLDGKWHIFSGDELGSILARRCLEAYIARGQPLDKLAMVASTVSSKLIEAMAAKEGFKFEECLTGFKYIGNVAHRLTEEGYNVPFGYEEAIGFMIGTSIRDKDGIVATACFAELASSLTSRGSNVSQYLEEIWQKYGCFKTANSYFVCHDPRTVASIFAKLRSFQGSISTERSYPTSIAGLDITAVRDLTIGYDSTNPPTYRPRLPLSSGHMIQFRAGTLGSDVNIALTIRTSGTEPKIKIYLEGSGQDMRKVEKMLPLVYAELSDTWLEATKNNLQLP